MKYCFITKALDNPATRYRAVPLADLFCARGDVVDWYPEPGLWQQVQLVCSLPRYDVVFIQRKLFSRPLTFLLGAFAECLVFDHDDAIFCRSDGTVSHTRANKYAQVTRQARAVIAGNDFLRAKASMYCDHVRTIPTSVDMSLYPESVVRVPDGHLITLVWIGSKSTAKYLEHHREILEAIGQSVAGVCLKVISDFDFELNHMQVRNVRWSRESEAHELASSDIGIAPMIDNDWTQGKCALKVIQYMASSLPVISSAVGANREVVAHGETGFLATDAGQWVQSVRLLADDPEARRRMGAAGRVYAEKKYSTEVCMAQAVSLIDEVSGRSRKP